MRVYETTFIINPQTDDATIDRQVKDVADIITTTNGRIMHTDHMGTRRMAYAINGLTQGYYASFIFEAPTEVLPKMERHFKLNEQYLRHLTVVYEGDVVDGVVQPPVDIFTRREPGRDRGRHDSRPASGERADRGPVEKAPVAEEAPAPAKKAPVAEET
ncbi:MAG: 30S ribosomal protein S6, partial [candidate division Zixibacteria bacterium]|nr:30S ribosomal protein S6 [candidate division Zixibacteria bacterium]